MCSTEPEAPTDHHVVLMLLLLAGSLAIVGLLLAVRQRDPAARSPRTDRVAAVACGTLAALLVVSWPSATVRGWLGFVDPALCLEKDLPAPEAAGPPAGIEALKADLRQQRLDVGPPNLLEVTQTVQLESVTGPDSPGRTAERWAVGGTDLGHPFVYRGRLGLVFGDTFEESRPGGPGWRSNVLGWVDRPEQDRLTLSAMTESHSGRARELLGSLKVDGLEQTVIPTNATTVGDTIVLHHMSVACWGGHGRWVVGHSGLATSEDGGRTFDRVSGARFPAGSHFAQVAFVATADEDGHHTYVFGIPEGRDGAVHLARVRTDQLLDLSAWRYWDGGSWGTDVADAAQVVPPPVGELSVAFNEYHGQWLMMYLDDLRGGIVMRTAHDLTGPWSRARLVVSSLEVPALYAPFLLPGTGSGPEVRYTMSRFDIYNVVLMRSRVEAVTPSHHRYPPGGPRHNAIAASSR